MKRIGKQILSFLCAVCMLFSSIGDLSFFAFAAESDAPRTARLVLNPVTDAEGTAEGTYEVSASFAVKVPEGENEADYLERLRGSVTLSVREITMPEAAEETEGTPDQTTPAEDGQNGNGTVPETEGGTTPETGAPSGETGGEETPNNDEGYIREIHLVQDWMAQGG